MMQLGWKAGLCLGVVAGVGLPTRGQAVSAPPLPGVELRVMDSAVDLSAPSAVTLHIQVVNGSDRTLTLWPGTASLLSFDQAHTASRCEKPPNSAVRPDADAKTLRPRETYSETLVLNTEVCRGLLQAHTVQVERVLAGGPGTQVPLLSPPVPVTVRRSEEDAVEAVLLKQADDWNRGDLLAFASGYKNSPDILFIGRKISHGYDAMLAAYQQGYATREAMGTLTFSGLEVQPLDMAFATATGHFHLQRTSAGGGVSEGYFLLVLEHTADGWKIVRDDTTAATAQAPAAAVH